VGERISLVVQTLAAISVACVLGLLVAWRLAIIMIASQPIIIVCFYVKKGFLKSVSAAGCKAQEEASKVQQTPFLQMIFCCWLDILMFQFLEFDILKIFTSPLELQFLHDPSNLYTCLTSIF
jgi:hypothetical protein